jgi:hypothetical protein
VQDGGILGPILLAVRLEQREPHTQDVLYLFVAFGLGEPRGNLDFIHLGQELNAALFRCLRDAKGIFQTIEEALCIRLR